MGTVQPVVQPWRLHQQWLKTRVEKEARLDPINEGVQPDVLQRGRDGMARQRSKSHDVRAATWIVSSMVGRSGEVVDALHRRKINLCCAQETKWKSESARMLSFGKAVIRELHPNNRTLWHWSDYGWSSGDCSRPSSVVKRHCGLMSHIGMKRISK